MKASVNSPAGSDWTGSRRGEIRGENGSAVRASGSGTEALVEPISTTFLEGVAVGDISETSAAGGFPARSQKALVNSPGVLMSPDVASSAAVSAFEIPSLLFTDSRKFFKSMESVVVSPGLESLGGSPVFPECNLYA